jgi:hypothetical protein
MLVSMANLIDSLTGFIDYALECIRFVHTHARESRSECLTFLFVNILSQLVDQCGHLFDLGSG